MENLTSLDISKEKVQKMVETQKEILKDDEDAFAKIVGNLSVKQIENMPDDELLSFNNYAENCYYVAEPEFDNKADLVEYVRSVLVYLVQSYEFSNEMDKQIQELNDLTKETNDTIKEYYGFDKSDPNITSIDIIEKAINDGLVKAQELGDEEKYNKILQSQKTFNESFTLDRIKELYKTLNPENLKQDAKCDRSVTIYKNYTKVQQKLGSRYDLVKVSDLEKRFLPEEYHSLNNLFIIAVIKYISKSMKDGRYSSDTAFFVSQLTTNLFMLHLGKIPKDKEEILLNNIKEFLDMVM